MATQRSCKLEDPMLFAGRGPSVKFKSLEDKAGYSSLQSLGVRHRPGLMEGSGNGGSLCTCPCKATPGQVWGLQGTCGAEGDLLREERQAAKPLVQPELP